MWSKELALRKRIGAYVRVLRCKCPDCRTVLVLQPPWAPVRVGATMLEVEQVVAIREQGGTWRQAAQAAGREHAPRKYRHWFATFRLVMLAILPRLPGLVLPPTGTGWLAQLRGLLGVSDGVLEALRRWLFGRDGVVLGPTCLVALDRGRTRGPPSP